MRLVSTFSRDVLVVTSYKGVPDTQAHGCLQTSDGFKASVT